MKRITNYDNYLIDENGNIWNIKKKKYMKVHITKDGYKRVTLTKDKQKKNFLVHRLVAIAYIDNPEQLETIHHIDGNKLNNNVNNLLWLSFSDSNKVYTDYLFGEKSYSAKLKNVDAQRIRLLYKLGYTTKQLADFYNVSLTTIQNVLSERTYKPTYINLTY